MPASASRARARAPAGWRSASNGSLADAAESAGDGRVRQPRGQPLERCGRAPGGAGRALPGGRARRRRARRARGRGVGAADRRPSADAPLDEPVSAPPPDVARRAVVDRRGALGVATVAALASSGEPVLAVCADALRGGRWSSARPPRRASAAARLALAAAALADEQVRAGGGRDRRGGRGRARRLGRASRASPAWPPVRARRPRRPAPGAGPGAAWSIARRPGGFLHLAWGPARSSSPCRPADAAVALTTRLGGLYRHLQGSARPMALSRRPRCARRSPGTALIPARRRSRRAACACSPSWASRDASGASRGPQRRILGGD